MTTQGRSGEGGVYILETHADDVNAISRQIPPNTAAAIIGLTPVRDKTRPFRLLEIAEEHPKKLVNT